MNTQMTDAEKAAMWDALMRMCHVGTTLTFFGISPGPHSCVLNVGSSQYKGSSFASCMRKAIKLEKDLNHESDQLQKVCSTCGTTENLRYEGWFSGYRCNSANCIPF